MSKENFEDAIRAHEQETANYSDTNRAAIESATVAIRALLLTNGGAAIALLAFLGAVESGNPVVDSTLLVPPLWWFAMGVGLSVTTAILAYFVNLAGAAAIRSRKHVWEHPFVRDTEITKRWYRLRHKVLFPLAIFAALSSLAAFFAGVYAVTRAASQLGI